MAAIYPIRQMFVDVKPGMVIGIHVCKNGSTSDTITVPQLASTTASRSAKQLRMQSHPLVTVTDDADDQVTLAVAAGDIGKEFVVVTAHFNANYGPEA